MQNIEHKKRQRVNSQPYFYVMKQQPSQQQQKENIFIIYVIIGLVKLVNRIINSLKWPLQHLLNV